MKTTLASLALALAPTLALAAPEGISPHILLQTTQAWNGTPYTAYPAGIPEITVRKITFAPGAQLAWHTHPMPAAGMVMAGELVVESRDGKHRRTFNAGELLAEMPAEHRGQAGKQGAEVVVFYAGTPGMPLSIDATAQ